MLKLIWDNSSFIRGAMHIHKIALACTARKLRLKFLSDESYTLQAEILEEVIQVQGSIH